MSMIIYYFSATGNSLAVAKKLQQQLPDCQLVPIASLLEQTIIKVETETVGLVFPLYFLGLPVIVEEFIAKLQLPGNPYLFAVVTRGNKLAGGALTQLNKLLQAKNAKLQAGFYLTLPDTYTPMLNLPDVATQAKQFRECELKIVQIAPQIIARKLKIESAPPQLSSSADAPGLDQTG